MSRHADVTSHMRESPFVTRTSNSPAVVVRPVEMSLAAIIEADYVDITSADDGLPEFKTQAELDAYIAKLEADMRESAKRFECEKAAKLRDLIRDLRTKEFLFA